MQGRQGKESDGFKSGIHSVDAHSLAFSRKGCDEGTQERKIGGGRPGCKSSWGYYLLVFSAGEYSARTRSTDEGTGAQGGEGEKGCMQTAVRGGLLTPFIHPSLVKPSDARGIGGSFQGFDGSSRQKGGGDCGTDGAKGQRVV